MLHEISFRVAPGTLTALVGPSGAGKTTTTHLVGRLYDPDQGAVRIGGHDLRDVTLESLHAVVGVVTQDAHMFHDTIRANLSYARPEAAEDELIEACRAAQIWDLISVLPDGLDTIVGDRGYRLSGGEKQRISVARLLLKAPSIVVLDEATAHLDSESEAAVQRALKAALTGRTSLVIAHRLSTIREADQILVMDGGRITERGRHERTAGGGRPVRAACTTPSSPARRPARRRARRSGRSGPAAGPEQDMPARLAACHRDAPLRPGHRARRSRSPLGPAPGGEPGWRDWPSTGVTVRRPSFIWPSRWARAATVLSWVTSTMVSPRSTHRFSSRSMISSRVPSSRLPVGSSASSTLGSLTSARAIATRCCWPPDSSDGRWRSRSPSPTDCSACSARARRAAPLDARAGRAPPPRSPPRSASG